MILTEAALSASPALALIASGEHTSVAAMARALGRDPDNFRKSLTSYESAGWIERKGTLPLVTDAGREVLAAIERANNPSAVTPGAEMPVGMIQPDPNQPRRQRDAEAQAELEASVLAKGVLQPILIRPTAAPDVFLIVAGEGRWIAACAVGLPTVPVLIRAMSDAEAFEAATIENEQRSDMNIMDRARAYDRIVRDRMAAMPDMTLKEAKEEVAARVGKTVRTIELFLTLLKLPEAKKAEAEAGKLGFTDAVKVVRALPKLAELTPRQWLILLEVLDAQERQPVTKRYGYQSDAAPCQRAAETDEDALCLTEALLLGEATELYGDDGYRNGLFSTRLYAAGLEQLRLKFGAVDHEPTMLDALLAQRTEACNWDPQPTLGEMLANWSPGLYVTRWLNGPFIGDAEILAEAAETKSRHAVETKQREDAQAETKAAREAEAASDKAFGTVVLNLNDMADMLGVEQFRTAYREAWAAAGVSGPFSVVATDTYPGCELIDAAGKPNAAATAEGLQARRRLLAMAVNFALGLTPTSGAAFPPPGSDDADEPISQADGGEPEPDAFEDEEVDDEPGEDDADAGASLAPWEQRLIGAPASPTAQP